MTHILGRDAAGWLALAAAPSFAAMALASSAGGGALERLCAPMPGFAGGGMSQMYWLMCVFHLTPWLRLSGKGDDRKVTGDAGDAG